MATCITTRSTHLRRKRALADDDANLDISQKIYMCETRSENRIHPSVSCSNQSINFICHTQDTINSKLHERKPVYGVTGHSLLQGD